MDSTRIGSANEDGAALARRLAALERDAGLGAALEGLRLHQVETGFVQDDLSEVQRFEFTRDDGHAFFSAQYNPARARRFSGRGVDRPPPGVESINDGCFLCAHNIDWQQQGAEVGYGLSTGRVPYTAWMNPFPLAVGHCVIAADAHIPQHWGQSGIGLEALVADLVDIAEALPGWITFYNGVGAGASIEGHLHYHALPRTPGLPAMPIELAADRHRVQLSATDTLNGAIARGLYPMDFAHWRGPADRVLGPASTWLKAWQRHRGGDADATANAMAVRHPRGSEIDLFFVPRVRSRSRAEGFGGVIGAFETMGEIICSRPDEHQRLESGQIEYRTIAEMLRHVSVAL